MDSHDLENLRSLIRDGRKTEAIAAVRAQESVDLKAALDVVNAIERGAGLVEVSSMLGHTAPAASGSAVSSGIVDPVLLVEVKELLGRRQKIAAIKLWRERTGVGLKDAKEAVEAIERGETPVVFLPTAPSSDASGLEAVKDAMRRGKKIEAIKLYRAATGAGLKEAKDAVESMVF